MWKGSLNAEPRGEALGEFRFHIGHRLRSMLFIHQPLYLSLWMPYRGGVGWAAKPASTEVLADGLCVREIPGFEAHPSENDVTPFH
jgi:hypothetical protein